MTGTNRVRLAAVASLVALLLCTSSPSAGAEGWDLVMLENGLPLSSHATWADCQQQLTARTRALHRLLHGERASGRALPELTSSLLCRPSSDGVSPPANAQPRPASPRWVLWRTFVSLSAGDQTSEEVHSVHGSLRECHSSLLTRFYELQTDGQTPALSGQRATGSGIVLAGTGREALSYRCLPEISRGLKTK